MITHQMFTRETQTHHSIISLYFSKLGRQASIGCNRKARLFGIGVWEQHIRRGFAFISFLRFPVST